jgi:hypothetical protein
MGAGDFCPEYSNYFKEEMELKRFSEKLSQHVPEFRILYSKRPSALRNFCDFISILTNNELISTYEQLYGPRHLEKRIYVIT